MKILEEFYYGNIPQINLEIPQSNRYQRALKLMNQNSERLTSHFDDKQRELFEKMNDCQSEMTDEVKKNVFRLGFILGARFILEVKDDEILDLEETA